ncbi:alginate lyase family protein [Paenibacillus aceris]|uniref:Alginate lyase family protein n=1 Tax=Paenibacillus aceris TaxID=869555 RepID=A0ABS4HXC8_9BACL|nr:alginate lyase family protein [Paenibacillus aceris]MBP1963203.1 hypothetical protein [Paenibacillus aceris]NHW38680.1 DNRLRE domain-containing protein [Paenibacillus aceris]
MPMNQADFFGIWDEAEVLWSTPGKWNYAEFPELKPVEDYVKLGDYDNAQIALLDYFKQRQTRTAMPYEYDEANAKLAPLLADQIIPVLKETYVDSFYVTKTPAVFSFDLLTNVKAAAGADKVISFMLMGRHKGIEPAYLYSSQHDSFSLPTEQCRPVLIVDYTDQQRAQSVHLAPSMDTFIRGYDDTNHSQEPLLEVLESGAPFDEHTRKAYLKFDLSRISGSVTSATLRLSGYTHAEEPVGVMLFHTGDNAWDEHTFTYRHHNGKTFSWQGLPEGTDWKGPGEPAADNQFAMQIANFTWLNPLIAEYAATNNEVYAAKYIDYMTDFIHDAEQYVTPGAISMGAGTFPKCFQASLRAANWVDAYHLLKGSSSVNAADHTMILKAVWKIAAALSTEEGYDPRNNHGIYETKGLYSIAVYFPELADSSGWIELANIRLNALITKLNFSDGSYSESSSSYSIGAADSFMAIKSFGLMNGCSFSETFDAYLRKMGYYIADLAFPDGYLPLFGDGSSLNARLTIKRLGELYEDDVLLYLGTGGKQGTPPAYASSFYQVSQSATMRSGWGADARYLFMNVKQERSHRHSDDNSIIYYANGRQLIVDPGTYSYSDEPISNWLRYSTEAHNTVEINRQSQDMTEGVFRYWTDNESFNFLEGIIYNVPGFIYYRDVLFLKSSYTIVSDYIRAPEGLHEYRQHWHFLPTANPVLDPVTGQVRTTFHDHLADIQIIPADPEQLSEAEIKDGYYSKAFYTVSNSKYAAFTKGIVQGDITYDTILYPTADGEMHHIEVHRLELSPAVPTKIASALQIDNIGEEGHTGYYYLSHEEDPQRSRRFDAFTFDGKLAYAEKNRDGDIRLAIIKSGQTFVHDSTTLISSGQVVNDIAIEWEGTVIKITGSNLAISGNGNAASAIAIYAPAATIIRLNGESMTDFIVCGNYIYVEGITVE